MLPRVKKKKKSGISREIINAEDIIIFSNVAYRAMSSALGFIVNARCFLRIKNPLFKRV